MRTPRSLALTLLACALQLTLTACAMLGRDGSDRAPLPVGWDTVEPFAFEQLLADSFGPAQVVYFDRDGFRILERTLDEMTPLSVRAALLFAHSRHEKAGRRLLERLEQRVVGPTRASDAGDVVAAAALAGFPGAHELFRDSLRKLAVGKRPHPDLEVRVECAVTCLALGVDAPLPFLLQVLRIDTYAGQTDERDFAVDEHTAWARGRAAQALSARAGVPCVYQPDGSIAHREQEAARLAGLLQTALP